MEYIEAVRYSACCMSAYAVARVVSPLYAARDRVFLLFGGTLAVEGLAYALTPTVVRLPRARAFYTAFRVLGGTCFAVLKANTSVLLVRVFSVDMVAPVSGLFLAFEVFSALSLATATNTTTNTTNTTNTTTNTNTSTRRTTRST